MITRRTLLDSATAVLALTLAGPVAARSSERIPVVATFSILGDMVERIGGASGWTVTTLVGPDGDTHVYQPTPADARACERSAGARRQRARVRGLARAADRRLRLRRACARWRREGSSRSPSRTGKTITRAKSTPRTKSTSSAKRRRTASTRGTNTMARTTREAEGHDHHGAFDPHAWQSLDLAVTYVDNITAALAQTDPEKRDPLLPQPPRPTSPRSRRSMPRSARSWRTCRPNAVPSSPRTTRSSTSAATTG